MSYNPDFVMVRHHGEQASDFIVKATPDSCAATAALRPGI